MNISADKFSPAEDAAPSRAAFLRRAGALGLAGAAALGYPLLDVRPSEAASPSPPRNVVAAYGKAVVRLGHLESYSGSIGAAAYSQASGVQLAVEEANKRNSRVHFELVRGDDADDELVGEREARRLVHGERVDALIGLTSTAVALRVMRIAEQAGVPLLQVGTNGTSITGRAASPLSFRTTSSNQMLTSALGPALLEQGKRWFFLTVDYEFGWDAERHLTQLLGAAGGEVVGRLRHRIGETQFAAAMQTVARSGAEVLVLCNSGADVQNACGAFVKAGLHQQMQLGGVLLGNENVIGLPVEQLVGSLWGYVWGPDAGGTRTRAIYGKLKAWAKGFPSNWSQYLGYIAGEQLTARILEAGTTEASKLVAAFEDGQRFDAGKRNPSHWRRCDHQLVQDTYAARIVPAQKRINAYEFFEIVRTVDGDDAAESCAGPDARAAYHRIAASPIVERQDYAPVSF